nr:DNA-deoxyinosine glycosylase [Oceanobacillus salinisoli]
MCEKVVSFPPVLPEHPKVLILGSMPSVQSLEKQQYYGNPRNHFWPILFELFGVEEIKEYDKRIEFAKQHGIALWDTIAACYREGSLDASISDEEPNDILGIVKNYPTLRLIACNGTKAYETFQKNFDTKELEQVHVMKMPSTSPIPGRYTKTFAEKVQAWREILNHI